MKVNEIEKHKRIILAFINQFKGECTAKDLFLLASVTRYKYTVLVSRNIRTHF